MYRVKVDYFKSIRPIAYKKPELVPEAPMKKTDDEWMEKFGKMQYFICREGRTEDEGLYESCIPKSENGIYKCAGCDEALFHNDTRYESKCGWPAFYKPLNDKCVIYVRERAKLYECYEVKCSQCHCHLGHVFNDGPKDKTGLRYCINSLSLKNTKDS